MTLETTALLRKSISRLPLSQEDLESIVRSYDAEAQDLFHGKRTGASLEESVTRHFFREYLNAALMAAKSANRLSPDEIFDLPLQSPKNDPEYVSFLALLSWIPPNDDSRKLQTISVDLEKQEMIFVSRLGEAFEPNDFVVELFHNHTEPTQRKGREVKRRIEMRPQFVLDFSIAKKRDFDC